MLRVLPPTFEPVLQQIGCKVSFRRWLKAPLVQYSRKSVKRGTPSRTGKMVRK